MREEDKNERYTRPRQKRFAFHRNRWNGAPWQTFVEAIFSTFRKAVIARPECSHCRTPFFDLI